MLLLWKFDLISQNLQMFVFCQQRLEHNLNINYQSFLSIAPVFAKRGLGQSQSWIHFCSYIYICICVLICISDVCLALRLSIRASWQFVSEPLLGQSGHQLVDLPLGNGIANLKCHLQSNYLQIQILIHIQMKKQIQIKIQIPGEISIEWRHIDTRMSTRTDEIPIEMHITWNS